MSRLTQCCRAGRSTSYHQFVTHNSLHFTELYFATACLFQSVGVGRLFHYLYVEFAVGTLFDDEVQTVAKVGFGGVGYVDACESVLSVPVERPQVEHVLYVFHGVHMAVHVDVAVMRVDDLCRLGVLRQSDTLERFDGAGLLVLYVGSDESVAFGENIYRLSCLGVYHRPDAASVAAGVAVGIAYGEVAACEEFHHVFHPCIDGNAVVGDGHFLHFHYEAREHPCLVYGVEVVHAVASLVGVEVGGVEQMVAQMPDEDAM